MAIQYVTRAQYVTDPTSNSGKLVLKNLLVAIESDASPEAQAIKDAYRTLQTDSRQATPDAEKLQADRTALSEAVRAYQQTRSAAQTAPLKAGDRPQRQPRIQASDLSEQAQADFKSLAGLLNQYAPLSRKSLSQEAARSANGQVLNTEG